MCVCVCVCVCEYTTCGTDGDLTMAGVTVEIQFCLWVLVTVGYRPIVVWFDVGLSAFALTSPTGLGLWSRFTLTFLCENA